MPRLEIKIGTTLTHSVHGIAVVNDICGTGNGSLFKFFTEGRCFYSDAIEGNKVRENRFSSVEWWTVDAAP